MAFQKTLNRFPERGVKGDFASTNPRFAILAGDSALRAGPTTGGAVTVGNFAFANLETGLVHGTHVAGYVVGFVHRNNQAIVPLGSAASMIVPEGRETALFAAGDFYTILDDDCDVGDPITATAAGGAPSVTPVGVGFIATKFKAAEKRLAGELVKITVDAI